MTRGPGIFFAALIAALLVAPAPAQEPSAPPPTPVQRPRRQRSIEHGEFVRVRERVPSLLPWVERWRTRFVWVPSSKQSAEARQ